MSKRRPPAPPTALPIFSREKDAALLRQTLERALKRAERDPKKLEQLTKQLRAPKRFSKALYRMLGAAATDTAPQIFRSLKARGPAMLLERRATIAGFEDRLYKTWKRPLDLLEMFIVVCMEMAEVLSARWPWRESPDRSLVFDVLRRLQARACQVAWEIVTLLKSGYAPAAHARWRTLHETAVTAHFIEKHGKDAAERYLLHEHVEALKAARQYQLYCRQLGYRRFSRKQMAEFRRNYNATLKKHGPYFKDDYGWAAVTLGRKRVTFADLEKSVRLQHLRPFYRMASYPVHATVKAIRPSLALAPGTDVLLTGPSNMGLPDPGHSAAISLTQITITLAMLWLTSDSLALTRVLLLFTDEIGDAFLKAQRALEAKARDRRRAARVRRTPRRK